MAILMMMAMEGAQSNKCDQNELAKKLVKMKVMAVELQQKKIVIKDNYKTQQHVFINKMATQQQEIECKLEISME
jgi:hypothetical protein